ncbi:helix-turn-helix transcriptional regulator [Enterobacter bugandensis]|nr:helix-turn-helix transcriptional regulator [Enterobacter bugandensis]EKS7120216.1 helix-turn-helix transcriptional regulator [Enterobacter bugandensis]HEM8066957.1 helix-turn-helix transcriptional regulator [Enterobacter hormaechei]
MVPKRLKEARIQAGLTQEKLGVLAGIEESTAYSRLSQYEKGTHRPTFEQVCAFAKVLNMPECYFYTREDQFAQVVLKAYLAYQQSKHKIDDDM